MRQKSFFVIVVSVLIPLASAMAQATSESTPAISVSELAVKKEVQRGVRQIKKAVADADKNSAERSAVLADQFRKQTVAVVSATAKEVQKKLEERSVLEQQKKEKEYEDRNRMIAGVAGIILLVLIVAGFSRWFIARKGSLTKSEEVFPAPTTESVFVPVLVPQPTPNTSILRDPDIPTLKALWEQTLKQQGITEVQIIVSLPQQQEEVICIALLHYHVTPQTDPTFRLPGDPDCYGWKKLRGKCREFVDKKNAIQIA